MRAYYILFSVCYFHLVSKMAPLLRYTELSLALSDRYVRSVYFVCHMHACMGDVCVCIYGNTVCVVNVYVLSYCARFDRHIRVWMHAFIRLFQPRYQRKHSVYFIELISTFARSRILSNENISRTSREHSCEGELSDPGLRSSFVSIPYIPISIFIICDK